MNLSGASFGSGGALPVTVTDGALVAGGVVAAPVPGDVALLYHGCLSVGPHATRPCRFGTRARTPASRRGLPRQDDSSKRHPRVPRRFNVALIYVRDPILS